ncbi:hypothetical protein R1flu_025295 [Riccia fluitans]|uniref:Uncharacterized protein n=1 Tax=Riccia fluitans TaxID=41844 RepID=A0ABD1Y1I1_9MARC
MAQSRRRPRSRKSGKAQARVQQGRGEVKPSEGKTSRDGTWKPRQEPSGRRYESEVDNGMGRTIKINPRHTSEQASSNGITKERIISEPLRACDARIMKTPATSVCEAREHATGENQ